ncbi:ABC transporter transmembrane protein [Alloactinosynnema sp. L-07]|uniref:ABC transporter transmembrane domain-containing protein n=1 Tax=Alloactinosynnema sp. L-07 TaxID=1653480 RepID=UPI00065EFB19|nr:ABC transporter ATP-binding protein [Alloactinosynnema sp. L-07]CRK57542.1 ABC transporter transmembrane protein [Alloactinosynnema sp. L-07]
MPRTPARYLLALVHTERRSFTLSLAYGTLCTISQALLPAAIGQGIDRGLIGRDQRALLWWGAAVLGLGVVAAVTGTLRDRAAFQARFGASYTVMRDTTRHAARLGAALSARMSTGDVVGIGAADMTRIGLAMENAARGAGAAAAILVVVAIMVDTSWRLGLVVLVGVPLIAALVSLLIRPTHARQQHLREQQAELTTLAVDIVDGLRVLRGIGGEDAFDARYRSQSQRVRESGVRVAMAESLIEGAKLLLPGVLVTVIVWLGARSVAAGDLGAGQLVAFYGYAVFLAGALRRVTSLIESATRAHVAAGRVITLLNARPDLRSGDRTPIHGTLTDPESGLTVPPEVFLGVACAAPSDAAEFADRLGRYHDSDATYAGIDLRDIDLPGLRRHVLVANNEAHLFTGPVSELATDRAIDTAQARDVVESTNWIAGAGREFSGGQRQRLRLARALTANPDVLILVEPTNAVDALTESHIGQAIADHRRGQATVVFTTSPILLGHAERVAYVEDGKVVAEAAHNDLMSDQRYRSLVTREEAE